MQEVAALGEQFARALAGKDSQRLLALLAPAIDFRAMTPTRTWQAGDPEAVLSILFDNWFENTDQIEALEAIDTDSFADRQRVGYRLSVSNADGRFLVEQQAYLSERDGRIAWMRVLCASYRAVGAA